MAARRGSLPFVLSSDDAGFRFSFGDALLASHARKLFLVYLRGQGVEGDLFAVELIYGELIANVARHAPGPLCVRLRWLDDGALLEIVDRGPGYELQAALPENELEESHRGLFIVASYGSELRVARTGGRTVTAVRLPIRRYNPGTGS